MSRNVKLTIEYDGTDFLGSQVQAQGRTVQGVLEAKLGQLTGMAEGQRFKINLAGRTDTGVHAEGQVINFLTEVAYPLETFRHGLNAILPFDIAVIMAEEVEESFHARFSAVSRLYRYRILNRASRSALEQRYSHWVGKPLDTERMNAAATMLIGEHDFASFAGNGWGVEPEDGSQRHGTVRNMHRVEVLKKNSDHIEIWLEANAFLPHMVRNIVGTLVQVGQHKLSLPEFEDILAAADRRAAGPTAPARGLCLVAVSY